MTTHHSHGTSAEHFEALARASLGRIPSPFREYLGNIVIQVQDFADRDMLEAVGLTERWHLSGLYQGRPVGEQSMWDTGSLPPTIHLFRQPLLREWQETGVSLGALVHHVVIHEVGHHFGLSDEDMATLEQAAG